MNKTVISSALLALTLLSGCATMAPKYTQPVAPIPTNWEDTKKFPVKTVQESKKPLADIPWRDFFVDAKLQKVLALALENNRDLRVAALNIERFQALYQIKQADLFPKVEAYAAESIQRIPQDLSSSGSAMTTHQYNVGLGLVSYELDMFGRVQSLKDQALEQFFATEQAQRAMQIALISQIASAWLTLAADQERLKLAIATLTSQQESNKLVQRRYDAGVSSNLDLLQARVTVEAARVDIARYNSQVVQDKNAINLLVGMQLPTELLPEELGTITAMKELSVGLSSDVLLHRPDILQAEATLKGANANIGAARAAFFPRIVLVSNVGSGSDELAGLFKAGSLAWSFAPRISLPIFDGGSNKANLKVAEVDRNIMVAQYEKAIQTAFREVADTLALRDTIDEQVKAQQSLTDSTAERYSLSQARFEKGVDSNLNVLDSQRSLYSAEQNLITLRQTRLTNMVTLYKVLGGGGSAAK